jgi:protein AbiQ
LKLFFYDVDPDYVTYLKNIEKNKRGFTRVPNVIYNNERKMVCGIVLEIAEYKYYVPISSYKKQQNNNILIKLNDDKYNQVKGSLRFNYMFPIHDKYIKKREFNESKSMGRKEFLRRQWVYCNLIIDEIREMANKTYQEVVNGNDKILQNASCDFKLLEKAADEYEFRKGEPTCQNN